MQVSQIWQYPVKSMIGSQVDTGVLDEQGFVGDRTWAVRDQVRGGIRGAKVLGGLMRVAAAYEAEAGGPVRITLPDGRVIRSGDSDVDQQLSAAIDHEVTLEALRPAEDLDHFKRGEAYHDDLMDELRSIFGRKEDEPLPDLSGFPEVIFEYESPPGTYHDAYPLLLVSTSAVRSLREAVPDSVVDVRRFRPSLVIDTGAEEGHPEFGWIGSGLRIGEAEVDVVQGCPRCVMVTREINEEVPHDRRILRHIVKDLDQNVGVYATVSSPGSVTRGDSVTLLA